MGTICNFPFMGIFWGHLAEVSSVIPRVEMAAEGVSVGAPQPQLSHGTQKLLQ